MTLAELIEALQEIQVPRDVGMQEVVIHGCSACDAEHHVRKVSQVDGKVVVFGKAESIYIDWSA